MLAAVEISLRVFDEQCRLMDRHYDGRVICVERQLEAAGGVGMSFTYKLKRMSGRRSP